MRNRIPSQKLDFLSALLVKHTNASYDATHAVAQYLVFGYLLPPIFLSRRFAHLNGQYPYTVPMTRP